MVSAIDRDECPESARLRERVARLEAKMEEWHGHHLRVHMSENEALVQARRNIDDRLNGWPGELQALRHEMNQFYLLKSVYEREHDKAEQNWAQRLDALEELAQNRAGRASGIGFMASIAFSVLALIISLIAMLVRMYAQP